jgi:peptide/nickel transport system permease protein
MEPSMNQTQDPLEQALELLNSGQQAEASAVLSRFLAENPGNEQAWHMLSYALTDRDKQVYALQRVLQINPDNKAARSQLAKLYEDVTAPAGPPASRPRRGPAARRVAADRRMAVVEEPVRAERTWRTILKAVLGRPSLVVGFLIVLLFVLVAAAAPLIAPPEDPEKPYIMPQFGFGSLPEPPSPEHPLGLTARQHDVLYGLVWGTRTALKVGLFVTLGRLLIGAVLGLISGHYGGWLDAVLMRITDAFMAFPVIAAVMVMIALFGREMSTLPSDSMFLVPSRQEQVIILTLVAFGWMAYARLLRGNVLAEREKDYMQAAQSIGAGNRRVIFRHLMPNVTQGLFVLVASDIGAVVVLLTMFTFIGLVRSATGTMEADWGQMLSMSRDWIVGSPSNAFQYWYTYVPASAAILLFSIGWNLIGDGLRDVMDPRLRKGSPSLRVSE